MSGTESQQGRGELGGENRPAVGILANGADPDAVAAAILRAQQQDVRVYVAAFDPTSEAVEFARQLDATVVLPDGEVRSQEELWGEVRGIVREAGHPGLVRHSQLTKAIDFEASEAALAESEQYEVEATLQPTVCAGPEVLVAIPAYNEEVAIADVVSEAQEVADEVLVVDDGSTDATVERARGAGATVIVHEQNRGYGGALNTSFQEAERSGAEYLVILDGDGQHDPSDIPRLVGENRDSGANIVIGSRFAEESETELPLYRRFGLRVINLLTNLSLGVVREQSRIADTQSGFRVYDQTAIKSLAAEETIGNQMGASTDILYHAHRRGYEVREAATTIDYDVEEPSSKHPVSHGLHLVNNILRTIERERPVTTLGVPGFASSLLGTAFGYLTVSNYISTGTFPLGIAMASVFFALAGILAAFTAIILHSLESRAEY
jgi:hypothetical protein